MATVGPTNSATPKLSFAKASGKVGTNCSPRAQEPSPSAARWHAPRCTPRRSLPWSLHTVAEAAAAAVPGVEAEAEAEAEVAVA